MEKRDKIHDSWLSRRKEAASFMTDYAKRYVKKFPDPERNGTPRGEPIGFGREKRMVACLLPLNPAFKFGEVATLAGVSPRVLRVWRTEDAFERLVKESEEVLADILLTTFKEYLENHEISVLTSRKYSERALPDGSLRVLKSAWHANEGNIRERSVGYEKIVVLDDVSTKLPEGLGDDVIPMLVRILPFLSMDVVRPILSLLGEEMELGSEAAVSLAVDMHWATAAENKTGFQRWVNRTEIKEMNLAFIALGLDSLVRIAMKSRPDEAESLTGFKAFVLEYIDILQGQARRVAVKD